MKIKFVATGSAPDEYKFDGEKISFNNEIFDLSIFEEGDVFEGIEGEIQAIRTVEKIDGELYITLCQKAPEGHWTGKDMDYIDAKDYDPTKLYVREKTPEEIKEGERVWGI